MNEKHYWFGYMEAGEKSTPVLRDQRIDTANPDTIYLFNLKRNEILEYRRDIIEPKLRELSGDEQALCSELKTAYVECRSHFTPRGNKIASLPLKGQTKPTVAANDADSDDDEDMDDFAEDTDTEWEEA